MSTPCRDCRKPIPNGSSGGHCAKCHESFRGDAAFDNHLKRDENGKYRCIHPTLARKPKTNEPHPYWQDDKDVWHYGARMTTEQKRKAGWIK